MNKLLAFAILGCIFLNCSEQSSNDQQFRAPSVRVMQKDKDNLCIACLKTTYGHPIQCHLANCCATLYCGPCLCIAGCALTIKERYRS